MKERKVNWISVNWWWRPASDHSGKSMLNVGIEDASKVMDLNDYALGALVCAQVKPSYFGAKDLILDADENGISALYTKIYYDI